MTSYRVSMNELTKAKCYLFVIWIPRVNDTMSKQKFDNVLTYRKGSIRRGLRW